LAIFSSGGWIVGSAEHYLLSDCHWRRSGNTNRVLSVSGTRVRGGSKGVFGVWSSALHVAFTASLRRRLIAQLIRPISRSRECPPRRTREWMAKKSRRRGQERRSDSLLPEPQRFQFQFPLPVSTHTHSGRLTNRHRYRFRGCDLC